MATVQREMIRVRLSSASSSSSSSSWPMFESELGIEEVRMSAIVMEFTGISVPNKGRDKPLASSVEFTIFFIVLFIIL